MDITQQLVLLFLGLAIGLVAGVVIGILFQRNRSAVREESTPGKSSEVHYGAVDPDHIHTLPAEESSDSVERACPVCGKPNPAENLFCTKCGGRLK